MRKAALAAHRARAAHAPHAVAGPHAALLLRGACAATGRAHYSSGPVAVGTLLYASGFQVKAQKCCAARAASREHWHK